MVPSTLTFSSLDWEVAQAVTVYGVDDLIDEGASEGTIIQHKLSSADDPFYGDIDGPSVVVWVADNDVAGVALTGGRANVTEGGEADMYSMTLTSKPEGTVVISTMLSSHASSQIVVHPVNLTFTPANWNISQSVRVMAVNDHVAEVTEELTIVHSVTSIEYPHCTAAIQNNSCGAGIYDGINVPSYSLSIYDNNVAGAIVERSAVEVTEGGPGVEMCVRLSSQPVDAVHVSVTATEWYSQEMAGVGQFEWSEISFVSGVQIGVNRSLVVSFDSASWNASACFNFSAGEDHVAEPTRLFEVYTSCTSDDVHYANLTELGAALAVLDNDESAVFVSAVDGPLLESFGNVSYSIWLGSQPVLPVVVNISLLLDGSEFLVSPSEMSPCTGVPAPGGGLIFEAFDGRATDDLGQLNAFDWQTLSSVVDTVLDEVWNGWTPIFDHSRSRLRTVL